MANTRKDSQDSPITGRTSTPTSSTSSLQLDDQDWAATGEYVLLPPTYKTRWMPPPPPIGEESIRDPYPPSEQPPGASPPQASPPRPSGLSLPFMVEQYAQRKETQPAEITSTNSSVDEKGGPSSQADDEVDNEPVFQTEHGPRDIREDRLSRESYRNSHGTDNGSSCRYSADPYDEPDRYRHWKEIRSERESKTRRAHHSEQPLSREQQRKENTPYLGGIITPLRFGLLVIGGSFGVLVAKRKYAQRRARMQGQEQRRRV